MHISFTHFSSLLTVYLLFLWLDNGDFPKICILCVRVIINKHSLEPFCVWITAAISINLTKAVSLGTFNNNYKSIYNAQNCVHRENCSS